MHYEKESEIIEGIDKTEAMERLKQHQYETYEITYPKRKINILYYCS